MKNLVIAILSCLQQGDKLIQDPSRVCRDEGCSAVPKPTSTLIARGYHRKHVGSQVDSNDDLRPVGCSQY